MKDRDSLIKTLIKRFILVLILIVISQSLISVFCSQVLFPFLNSHLHLDISQMMSSSSISLTAFAQSLLWFICFGLSQSLPGILSSPFRSLADLLASSGLERYVKHLPSETVFLSSLGLFFLFLLILLIYFLPFFLAALIYCRWIVKEIGILRKEDAMAQEAFNQQRNLLLSDVAHDLKTPITTISGYADALKQGMVQEETKQQEYLTAISAKSLQMSRLINLLFQYVTLDSEGFHLTFSRENICELLLETIAASYSDFEAADMTLEIQVPEIPVFTDVDKIQLSRAVTNLLQNAIKHNEPNVTVCISLEDKYDHLEIAVADTGAPIEDAIRAHLFDPFVMGDTSRKSRGGSGLGLSISAKIMQLHKGTLQLLQPAPDPYEKAFVITLPVEQPVSN